MQIISVPKSVEHQPQINCGEIRYVHYSDKGGLFKNRVIFDQCAISFVLNGQKEIYHSSERTIIKSGQGMLIPAGNTIIAEHSLNDNPYSSFIVFFPRVVVSNFLNRQIPALSPGNTAIDKTPYIYFSNTAYLTEYLRNIQSLINSGQKLSDKIALHKLEELLLIIYELFPAQLMAMFGKHHNNTGLSLKTLVENNLFNRLTLEELAFLANRSLSSFKRDFEKAHGISPQKYIRERKLETACAELEKGKQASELYDTYGYENLSNFNTAFKKKFGITPAAYRQSRLI